MEKNMSQFVIEHNVPKTLEFLDKAKVLTEDELIILNEEIWNGNHAQFMYEFVHHGDAVFCEHPMFERVKEMYFNAYV
jgi:hypothetical protein